MLRIDPKDILARLCRDNPWWDGEPDVAEFFRDLPLRLYFETFLPLATDRSVRRAVVLLGPRRVGKTVMLYQTVRHLLREKETPPNRIFYASLDTPTYTGLGLEQIMRLASDGGKLDLAGAWVFFDEIQYLKDWERHLKSMVDSYPDVRFIVSGSAAAALRLKSEESGAGRFTQFMLPPLSFAEFVRFQKKEAELFEEENGTFFCKNILALNSLFIDYLNYGGYPEAVFSETIRKDPGRFIRQDIIDKVLLRDLPSLYGISDTQELNRFFSFLAYNTGNELSWENMSKEAAVKKETLRRYLEYLEAAFLVAKLRRVDENCRHFTRERNFKVYLANPAIRAALFEPVSEDDETLMGRMAETTVVSQWLHDRTLCQNLRYARWKDGEIDLVIIDSITQKPAMACEIKWTDTAYNDKKFIKNLLYFKNRNNLSRILMTSKKIAYHGKDFYMLPTSYCCFTIGSSLIRGVM